ncbi:hypothetical protein ABTN02_19735, partial [Acinetobacter baumannii]
GAKNSAKNDKQTERHTVKRTATTIIVEIGRPQNIARQYETSRKRDDGAAFHVPFQCPVMRTTA